MAVQNELWKAIQNHLGYNEEEMKLFRENPINEDILAKLPEFGAKTIVFEVIESNGCNSGHKKGDKFYFDFAGNLITKKNPSKICIYALQTMLPAIFAANELFYAGINPNEMRFKNAGCFDVGVKCGGWGRILLRFSMEDRIK